MNPNQAALAQVARNPATATPTPINPLIRTPQAVTPQVQTPTPTNPSVITPQVLNQRPPAPPVSNAIDQLSGQQGQAPQGSIDYNQLKKEGYSPTQIEGYLSSNPGIQLENAPDDWAASIEQDSILSKAGPITERFGEHQGIEVFSDGITYGTGIGVPVGTSIATPPGQWRVVSAFSGARQKGYIGDNDNEGWGNSIVIKNVETGEELRYSHLSQLNVANGDTINGNRVIGLTGESGSVTGPHLNLAYIMPNGQYGDVLQSAYAEYLPIKQ